MGHGNFLNSTGRHEHVLNSTGRHAYYFLKSTCDIRTPRLGPHSDMDPNDPKNMKPKSDPIDLAEVRETPVYLENQISSKSHSEKPHTLQVPVPDWHELLAPARPSILPVASDIPPLPNAVKSSLPSWLSGRDRNYFAEAGNDTPLHSHA